MSTFNGKSFSDMKNLNLKGGATGTGLLRWSPAGMYGQNAGLWASNPFGTTDYGLYINSSGSLVFSSAGSTTILGAPGGAGALPTWDQIFVGDKALDVLTTALTVTSSSAGSQSNNVMSITATAGGSGALLSFTNGTTSLKDINGTGSSWAVTGAGAATFASVIAETLTAASTTLTLAANAGNAIVIGTGSNTVTIAKAASFSSTIATSSTITSTNSSVILTSNSNTVAPLIVTDNTVTSFGTAASEGLVVIRSTSITSGTLLRLQAAEGTITGDYLNCFDSAGVSSVFTIRAAGATVITGSAYATPSLTLTSGDLIVSAGKITHTAAGATTTGGFLGTYVGITTGYGMSLVHTTSVIADGGSLFRLASSGIDTGGATNGALFDFKSTAQLAGTVGRIDSIATTGTILSIIGTGIMTTTGNVLTITANVATTAAGLLRVNGNGLTSGIGLVVTSSATALTGAGRLLRIDHTGATTSTGTVAEIATIATDATNATTLLALTSTSSIVGVSLKIADAGTVMTTGSLLRVTSGTTGAVATNGIVSFVATGAHTSTSNAGFVNITDATLTGTVLAVNATALTTGIGFYMPSAEAGLTGAGRYVSIGGKFTIGKFGATVIAGSAAATPALTLTAGDILLTSGNITLTANASTITSTGTGANGMVLTNPKNGAAGTLTGTALNVEISIGGTPYYFAVYPTKS